MSPIVELLCAEIVAPASFHACPLLGGTAPAGFDSSFETAREPPLQIDGARTGGNVSPSSQTRGRPNLFSISTDFDLEPSVTRPSQDALTGTRMKLELFSGYYVLSCLDARKMPWNASCTANVRGCFK